MDNRFIDIPLSSDNLDIYYLRKSIFNSFKKSMPSFSVQYLDMGCSKMLDKDYILEHSEISKYVGLDIENAFGYHTKVKPDFFCDGIRMPFEDSCFYSAMATEVIEH